MAICKLHSPANSFHTARNPLIVCVCQFKTVTDHECRQLNVKLMCLCSANYNTRAEMMLRMQLHIPIISRLGDGASIEIRLYRCLICLYENVLHIFSVFEVIVCECVFDPQSNEFSRTMPVGRSRNTRRPFSTVEAVQLV